MSSIFRKLFKSKKINLCMDYLFRNFVLYTWCFPQTFLGVLLLIKLKIQGRILEISNHKEIMLIITKNSKIMGGISLGKFIFVNENRMKSDIILHEYGHTIQGYIFGPLYIILIGIPSELLVIRYHLSKNFTREDYHNSYPENWADKLGGVKKK